tara:strand:- start:448 stop:1104 length:657 start_codon:yes stop_codon:yes gene_type:complete
MSTYEANRYSFPASAITAGTFDNARLSSGSVTQHVDLSNLNASNLTSGSIPNARVPSGAVTQHVSAVTQVQGSWTPSFTGAGITSVQGRYSRVGGICICHAAWRWSSRASHNSHTYFNMGGLPITSRNSGNISGNGYWTNYRTNGIMTFLRVVPNSTTVNFYISGSNIGATTKYTGGGGYNSPYGVMGRPDPHRFIVANMHDATNSNNYGNIQFIYEV